MNLKILFGLCVYWIFWIIFLTSDMSPLYEEAYITDSIDLNVTALSDSEQDTGGLFSSGVSFGRFAKFTVFGIGLPSNYPSWLKYLFGLWQTILTLLTIGFFLDALWSG